MPVLGIGLGLDAVAAHVEPYRRIERGILADEDMDEFVMENGAVFRSAEVALGQSPVANGFRDTRDELAHASLAFGSAERTMKVLAGHDVGGGHGPVFGNFYILLLEDDAALGVGDLRSAEFP